MKQPVETVVSNIIEKVHEACEAIGITDGAIGVCIEPKSSETAEWVNLPPFSATVTYTAPINRETEETLCREKNGKLIGDTAGVVAMKIASARQLLRYNRENLITETSREELTSGAIPEELVGIGMTKWKGCVAIPVGCLYGAALCPHRGALVMNIYVAVSGGTEDQDEEAAWAALEVIKDFTDREDGYMLQRCLYGED